MRKLATWVLAQPARAFVAAAGAAVLALPMWLMGAWLPAAVVVLAVLGFGSTQAALVAVGAALPIAWAIQPLGGLAVGIGVALVVLVPALLAARVLEATRSLSFTFQAVTIAACVLLVAIHAVIGDPVGVLTPLLDRVMPVLEETARTLRGLGIESTPEELGATTARAAWATTSWLVLLHTMVALFAGLALYGSARDPGLFGREFRALKLGRVIAWGAVVTFVVGVVVAMASDEAFALANDLLFVLSGAFLLQALAVVHGLREAQVIGPATVALAYLSVVLLPHGLVGVGLADTWVRFRERLGRKPGAAPDA